MKNKGFSLVELIIVIAIMAILVGVIAPQLIKYIEKSNVSSDTQLCDAIRSALEVAMADPEVLESTDNSRGQINFLLGGNARNLSYVSGGSKFQSAVCDILGFDVFDGNQVQERLKSNPAKDMGFIMVQARSGGDIAVWVVHSDKTGNKHDFNGTNLGVISDEIVVGNY